MEWRKARPRRQKKKKKKKTIITYRIISKKLTVETTSIYCSCSITPSHHSCSSLLKSTHAFHITCAEMHADHIVSAGSLHNNALHFSSSMDSREKKVPYGDSNPYPLLTSPGSLPSDYIHGRC